VRYENHRGFFKGLLELMPLKHFRFLRISDPFHTPPLSLQSEMYARKMSFYIGFSELPIETSIVRIPPVPFPPFHPTPASGTCVTLILKDPLLEREMAKCVKQSNAVLLTELQLAGSYLKVRLTIHIQVQ